MKKLGFTALIASGLAAAVVGIAAPASADTGHHDWIYSNQSQATAPHVDTTVHQSR